VLGKPQHVVKPTDRLTETGPACSLSEAFAANTAVGFLRRM
jgi:hypothetical protein